MRHLEFTYPEVVPNLALDEALLEEAEDAGTGPVVRTWEPPRVAVVLGASGRFRDEIHLDACRQDGVSIARRSSGGGTVVIGPGALNVSVVLSCEAAPGLGAVDAAQHFVLDRLAVALRAQGVAVQIQGSADLTLGSLKFAGSAQRRLRSHFLVHTSVLYQFPLRLIGRYIAVPRRQPAYRDGRTHEDFVTNLGVSREQLLDAVRAAWLPDERFDQPDPLAEERVRALVDAKFGDPAWTERF